MGSTRVTYIVSGPSHETTHTSSHSLDLICKKDGGAIVLITYKLVAEGSCVEGRFLLVFLLVKHMQQFMWFLNLVIPEIIKDFTWKLSKLKIQVSLNNLDIKNVKIERNDFLFSSWIR